MGFLSQNPGLININNHPFLSKLANVGLNYGLQMGTDALGRVLAGNSPGRGFLTGQMMPNPILPGYLPPIQQPGNIYQSYGGGM